MNRKNITFLVLILQFLIGGILVLPVMAATTELTITKYANDGITILNQTTKNYSWLEANLPVKGDGSTHYYHQGPTFNDSDPYDPAEWQNVETRDWGAVKGTDVKDLCGLAGGAHTGDTIRIKAADGLTLNYPYEYVYTPDSRQGPMVITWYNGEESAGGYENQGTGYPPDYFKGMRLIMFADTSSNPWGYHVFGNCDMLQVWAPQYRYNYTGIWPSSGGISEYNVRNISIMSMDPVPSPPVAAFTNATPRIGTAPLTVTFTDQSTGTLPLTYAWDFNNDGMTDSTTRSPSHVYSSSGTYTVNLTVSNSVGRDSEVKLNYITVSPAPVTPVAAFTNATPRIGTAPLTVTFTDQSTNTPTSWKWEYKTGSGIWTEFGSGARNPSQIFAAGTYDIRLTATNAGGSASELKTSYIVASTSVPPPVANFFADVTSGIVPLAVQFTDTSTGTGITAWTWDFNNDGITDSSLQNPSFTYTSSGTYTVNLTVTNAIGSSMRVREHYIIVTSGTTSSTSDIGVFRPSAHQFIFNTTPVTRTLFGLSTDIPITGDWNGDGITDIGVFRPSAHQFIFNTTPVTRTLFGLSTDIPITGDWNGDGITDIGVFRPSAHQFIFNSMPVTRITFGLSTDIPITGDWNGDGITDIGVFRPSAHQFIFNRTPVTRTLFGLSTDIPITGDWNGDGITDIGIFRPSARQFIFNRTPVTRITFGLSTDIPITGNWG